MITFTYRHSSILSIQDLKRMYNMYKSGHAVRSELINSSSHQVAVSRNHVTCVIIIFLCQPALPIPFKKGSGPGRRPLPAPLENKKRVLKKSLFFLFFLFLKCHMISSSVTHYVQIIYFPDIYKYVFL